jgi:predicted RNase H-like HicB family nuclease
VNARHDIPLIVPVVTFAPAKIEPTKNIYVVVQPTDGEYVATLFDANLAMTGDTQEEAVANLKELIVEVFESLEADEAILAPGMANQLAVLRSLLKKQP